jgi:glycosyltransferase involved in cell wall biosynthesis
MVAQSVSTVPTADFTEKASATIIDLVLPCYNPPADWAANLISAIQRLNTLLPHVSWHVFVVNDGSPRGVSEADVALLKAGLPRFTYIAYTENRGKGHALRTGIAQTTAPLVLFTDIDFPYEEASVVSIVNPLVAGTVDVATGARDEIYYASVPAGRVVISKLLRRATRHLLGLAVTDTQTGLKGFNTVGKAIFLRTTIDRYLFDLEFIFLASRASSGLRVQPIPVRLKPGIVFSKMNIKVLMTEGRSFARLLVSRFQ